MEIKVNDSMIIDIEEYIKDLSPELQEKARACKTTDELLALAKKHSVPLPDEALEAVAGGAKYGIPDEPCPARENNLHHDFEFECYGHETLTYEKTKTYKCKYCGEERWIYAS